MIIWTVFILSTFLTQITFLNMLIAIMGDTFSRVSEIKKQMALKEKIGILADYVIVVRDSPVDHHSFLYSVTSHQLGADEQDNWEGTITSIKQTISAS